MHRSKGHKLLSPSDADENDRIIAGRSYTVRYLGSKEIPNSDGKGDGCTDAVVAHIYSRYSNKAKFKKLTTKELFVSANCVSLCEPNKGVLLFRYSTVNVTFCNTNKDYHNAFVFVGRDVPSSALHAHVVHCDSAAKANEMCTAMSQAFEVRCALYQAKRIEKAGWATGKPFQLKPDESSTQSDDECSDDPAVESMQSGDLAQEDVNNNNIFGDFACATPPSQSNGYRENPCTPQNGLYHNNGWSSEGVKEGSGAAWPSADINNLSGNGGEFPLAKMLLGLKMSRGRSHSMPYSWADNAQNGLSQPMNGHGTNGSMEDDDFDAFSTFANERSLSMSSLVRPVS